MQQFMQFAPSTRFIESVAQKHLDKKCSLITIDQTKLLEADKVKKIWEILETCDATTMPYHRVLSLLIFYSSHFRMKCITKNFTPLTADDCFVIQSEWMDLVNCDSLVTQFEYCICGHEIAHPFYVKNTINGNILKMSGDCVKKFCSPVMSDVVNIIRTHRQYRGDFKMCGNCCSHKIPVAEAWRSICQDCYAMGFRENKVAFGIAMCYRACKECGDLNIAGCEPSYKDMCAPCYKKKMALEQPKQQESTWSARSDNAFLAAPPAPIANRNSYDKVACQKCGLKKIAQDKAHLFKICYTCNQNR